MTDARDPESGAHLRLKNLRCRRTGQWLTPEEHLRCPYCLGDKESLGRGEYAGFCDYDPKKDPISFGFPPDGSHMTKG